MRLTISHKIRTKEFPVNLSRAILKASRRKHFLVQHVEASWHSLTACGKRHYRKKSLESDWLSVHQIGGTSVQSSACNSHFQSPKAADFCELRSITNSRSHCSHPYPVTLSPSIWHRSWLKAGGEISRLTQTAAFKTQNVYLVDQW